MKKFVSLTSPYLRIYEDDHSNNTKSSSNGKSKSNVLIMIPILSSTINCCTKKKGHFKRGQVKEILSITSSTSNLAVDLVFDPEKEKDQFIIWKKCLAEAKDICHTKINRLKQARNTVAFLTEINSPKTVTNFTKWIKRKSSDDISDIKTGERPTM